MYCSILTSLPTTKLVFATFLWHLPLLSQYPAGSQAGSPHMSLSSYGVICLTASLPTDPMSRSAASHPLDPRFPSAAHVTIHDSSYISPNLSSLFHLRCHRFLCLPPESEQKFPLSTPSEGSPHHTGMRIGPAEAQKKNMIQSFF